MYFEMAVRDIRALPKLEGTVHVNMALVIKFMSNYFFKPGKFPKVLKQDGQTNDDFLFNQGPARGLGKVKFHDYKLAYNGLNLPNIKIVRKQIRCLKLMLIFAKPGKSQREDFDFLLILGELFTLVVYGQLILENAAILGIDNDLVDQIFDFIIRDFSKYALQLYSKTSTTTRQKMFCKMMLYKPVVNSDRFKNILENHVYSLIDQYEMNH
jgi:acyl-CoA dehydrogenase